MIERNYFPPHAQIDNPTRAESRVKTRMNSKKSLEEAGGIEEEKVEKRVIGTMIAGIVGSEGSREEVVEQRVIRATRDGAINQDDNGNNGATGGEIGCKMSSVSESADKGGR